MTYYLSEPLLLEKRGAIVKNRFMKSAMSEGMASEDHAPTEELIHLYERWAEGGAGLVVTGNVMITGDALGEPGNVVLEDASDLHLFRKWAKAGKKNGNEFWMQINHPGKQVVRGLVKEGHAPSAIPFSPDLQRFFAPPRALTTAGIHEVIRRFKRTALLAKEAGFTGVQIHAAHGYLISQFLSPRHNQRTDEWGGPIENRARFLREVCRAVRSEVGEDYPVGVKINSADFMKAGFTEEESIYVIKSLEEFGIDLIEISGGTYEKAVMTGKGTTESKREAYFLEYAERLKKETTIPIAVTGGFRTKEGMEQALAAGGTDMIGLARPLAVDPSIPDKLLKGELETLDLPAVKTGIPAIDKGGMMEIMWFSQQLDRIGKGQEAKPNFSPKLSLLKSLWENGTGILKKRRV
ncbi:NADH:flavin oxidoreductase/NADH oxidase family protein [Salimicrobium halophilum]|uniref:2,4-dienoyl-CoA reductase n=1 Tax=Salimicrobium halophilum TaxID=86666 RepID=A0A1G8UBW9_9BACI|nr:NADH:flavin oxidoreductase/NADH oxidase family protein [Salimicrobium halophilum]SDJ51228.1 2,4-dienoyl-CoA reductase [Salimicrobium halophilum]